MRVNYLAVLAAAVAAMIVGFIWYSPGVFGNLWLRIIGKDKLDKAELEEMQQESRLYFAVMFVATFIGASVLARFIVWLGAATLGGGLRVGFWAWLGFAFPLTVGEALFSGKEAGLKWPLFLVRVGHHLAGLLVMGAILGAWM